MIDPRTLKGFRDYLPELMLPREALMETARQVFRSYGYPPIETPALEYAEILLGKLDTGAEINRQVYRFKDHGGREVALRFDLTVPFARFAAQYIGKLGTPFKRYHIGPVWRGENTQAGRFREFYQCDFDIIGTTSNVADIEIALVIHDLMAGLGFERFTISLNNRLLLNGLLEELGVADRAVVVLRVLDKLAKLGKDAVLGEMTGPSVRMSEPEANRVVALVERTGTNQSVLSSVATEFGKNAKVNEGVSRLTELLNAAEQAGIPDERLKIDLGICRGLDYYTGTIYETFLSDLPRIGSVCSGGRYDDLASLYTKQKLPGVGASLGLDRLIAAMEELNLLPKSRTPADVMIVLLSIEHLGIYEKTARDLRAAGVGVEVFPDAKKPGQQLQYAEAKGYRFAILIGAEEIAANSCKIRDLASRAESVVGTTELMEKLRELLKRP